MFEKDPSTIEEKSFEIIHEEALKQGIRIEEKYRPIVYRMIHTTADFEYGKLVDIHEDFLPRILQVLRKSPKIYVDTQMIKAGLNRGNQKRLNIELVNHVHEEEVKALAIQKGITRSMVSIQKAIKEENIHIFVCGNAPTAIFQLKELQEQGYPMPEVVIAVPVGFVGAAESKELAKTLGVPYITVDGRKGGSTVAVSILNALMKLVE